MDLAASGLCACQPDRGNVTGRQELRSICAIAIAARRRLDLWNCCFWAFRLVQFLRSHSSEDVLLPLLAQTTGNVVAVILTALLFALLHQPTDLAHWVLFTATGAAYGWIRVASGSTMAAALMHATYNLDLCVAASF